MECAHTIHRIGAVPQFRPSSRGSKSGSVREGNRDEIFPKVRVGHVKNKVKSVSKVRVNFQFLKREIDGPSIFDATKKGPLIDGRIIIKYKK